MAGEMLSHRPETVGNIAYYFWLVGDCPTGEKQSVTLPTVSAGLRAISLTVGLAEIHTEWNQPLRFWLVGQCPTCQNQWGTFPTVPAHLSQ